MLMLLLTLLLLMLLTLLVLMLQCFETQAVNDRASFAGKGGLQRHDSLGIGHRAIAALLSRLRIIFSSALRIMMIGAIIGCGGRRLRRPRRPARARNDSKKTRTWEVRT
jgi:hypothetical protein